MEDFNKIDLECDSLATNKEIVENLILGEWKSIEIEGDEESLIHQRKYTSEFIFINDSDCRKNTNWNDSIEDTVVEYSYNIIESQNEDYEFIIELLNINPIQIKLQLCENEILVYSENYLERYMRN